MKITKIAIKNYRILKDVVIEPKDILALVGKNNSGKSTVLNALELFFENSIRLVSKESFYSNDTSLEISIELWFSNLSDHEKEDLKPWLHGQELRVRRTAKMDESDNPVLNTIAIINEPKLQWLKTDDVSATNINEWKKELNTLKVRDTYFKDFLIDGKTTVESWKNAITNFINQCEQDIEFEEVAKENPKGYPNVLKGTLPEFILIPAVRNASEEAKATSTSAFGKLLNKLIDNFSEEEISTLSTGMNSVNQKLNRSPENIRMDKIEKLESSLNSFLSEIINCDLELEFSVPTIKDVIGQVKIYVGDGFRTGLETKGHGLQRSVIFTILRAYAELKNQPNSEGAQEQESRTTIFAFEEPEIYLHPLLQKTLFKTIRRISAQGDQVFYCTHSSSFVDIEYFDEICLIKRTCVDESDKAEITQLTMNQLLTDLKVRKGVEGTDAGIRELYSYVFDPLVTEGFFADKVVIVEGPSERYILPIYSSVINFDTDKENVAVVHAHGKGPMDRLLRIFSGFNIPTYIWFDGDKNNTDKNIKAKSIELLNLLGDPIKDINKLETQITQTYAVLETNLEGLLETEIATYSDLYKQAKQDLGEIGKPLMHRYMANKLVKSIAEGSKLEDTVPKTILKICEQIQSLNECCAILKNE